ncbi:hypothetical protein FF1_037186 [Malus domestica]
MPCLPETLLSINDDHFDCLSDSLIINEIDDVNDLSVDDPDSFAADNNILDQSDVTHHSPNQVLKNYNEIRFLQIELPSDELGIDDEILLNRRLILAPPYTTVSSLAPPLSSTRDPPKHCSFEIGSNALCVTNTVVVANHVAHEQGPAWF